MGIVRYVGVVFLLHSLLYVASGSSCVPNGGNCLYSASSDPVELLPCCNSLQVCTPSYNATRWRCRRDRTTTAPPTTTATSVQSTTATTTLTTTTSTSTRIMTTTASPTTPTTTPTTTSTASQTTTTIPETTTSEPPYAPTPTEPSTAIPTTTSSSSSTSTTSEASTSSICEGRGVIRRKNIKSMTQSEWDDYVEAVNLLTTTPSGTFYQGTELNLYEASTLAHVDHSRHFDDQFLIWHRLFVWEWDKLLHSVKPGVVQPYFDWSVVNADVFSDSIFGPDMYGSSVSLNGWYTQPIPNGKFQGLFSHVEDPHLVTRNFNKWFILHSRQFLDTLIQAQDFSFFTVNLEYAHGTFHISIGGDMEDFLHSPNSVFFYLHHAFIDKLFADWLDYDPSHQVGAPSENLGPWGRSSDYVMQELSKCVIYEDGPAPVTTEAPIPDVSRAFADTPAQGQVRSLSTSIRSDIDEVPIPPGAPRNETVERELVAKRKIEDPVQFKKDLDLAEAAQRSAALAAARLRMPRGFRKKGMAMSVEVDLKRGLDTSEATRVHEMSASEIRKEGIIEEREILEEAEAGGI